MTKKRRLLVRYGVFSAATLVVCVVGTILLLRSGPSVPEEGLVPGITDDLAAEQPDNAPKLQFTRVPLDGFRVFPGTRTHRLPEDMGCGVVVEDFDGDGLPDLFFVNSGPLGSTPPPCAMYKNLGNCRFERVATSLPAVHGLGASAADYDGDGDFDLFITAYGHCVLLRNDGDFHFTDVTKEAGLEKAEGFCTGSCWADVNGDSALDLYVSRYVAFDDKAVVEPSTRGNYSLPATLNPSTFPAQTNLLYINDGKGHFTEEAKKYRVSDPGGKGLSAVFADFDGDGVEDLYVANDITDNVMFQGRRNGSFVDVSHPSCTADWRGSMGIAIGDYDRDGDLDLFLTHWVSEENALYDKQPGFYFRDASWNTALGPPSRGLVGWACGFDDLDNDGRPDLWVVNGSTFEEKNDSTKLVPMLPQIFWNGGRRFFDLGPASGIALQKPFVGRGGACADLDGDGDCDLVFVGLGQEPLVLRNDTKTEGHHLDVAVYGSGENVFGYGATVTVEAGRSKQIQEVATKVSYLSWGPHLLHFGLGKATSADRVVVRYPSGRTVERRHVPADTRLSIKEVDPRTLGPKMDVARDALGAGDTKKAEKTLREILALDPLHPGALYELARLTDPAEGIALCHRLLHVEPMLPRGHLLAAKILSNPARPELLDLNAALDEIHKARHLNRDETGSVVEEGRIRLLAGKPAEAAQVLEPIAHNPHAAALAALCLFRIGKNAEALRLLGKSARPATGDTAEEVNPQHDKSGASDFVGRLLLLPRTGHWELARLPIAGKAGAPCSFRDENRDGSLDAVVGGEVVYLKGTKVLGESKTKVSAPQGRPQLTPYSLEKAAAFALSPPDRCEGPPPGATAVVEADVDGDGHKDLVVACGGDDPAAPLPWWVLLKRGDHYVPVRGDQPFPGFRAGAIAARDLDGDGRAEILLRGGGYLPGDSEGVYLARYLPDERRTSLGESKSMGNNDLQPRGAPPVAR